MKTISPITFEAKLKINLSDEYLDYVENRTMFPDTDSQNLRRGLRLLEELSPKMGNDGDIIELSSKNRNELSLSFIDKDGKITREIKDKRIDIAIRNSLSEIFTAITRRYDLRFNYSQTDTIDNMHNIREITSRHE